MEKSQGTVKWFSRVKGYGFIQPDGESEDVFVHYSAITGEGFRNLEEGNRVEFAVEDTPKGPQAVDVVRLGAQAGAEVEDIPQGPQAVDVVELDAQAGAEVEDIPQGPQAVDVVKLGAQAGAEEEES